MAEWISQRTAADLVGCCTETIERHVAAGTIRHRPRHALGLWWGAYDIHRGPSGRNRVPPPPSYDLRIYDITYYSTGTGSALHYVEVKANKSRYTARQRRLDNDWRAAGHLVEFFRVTGIPTTKKVWTCIKRCPPAI